MRWVPLAMALGFLAGCSTPMPPHLLGRWRSDEERTIADIDARGQHTPEQRAALGDMFGDLVYEFRDDGTYAWMIDGFKETAEYRITAVGPDYVEFEGADDLVEEPVQRRIWIGGPDSFWIWVGHKRLFREYFRREP